MDVIISAITRATPSFGFFQRIQARTGVNRKKFISQVTYQD